MMLIFPADSFADTLLIFNIAPRLEYGLQNVDTLLLGIERR